MDTLYRFHALWMASAPSTRVDDNLAWERGREGGREGKREGEGEERRGEGEKEERREERREERETHTIFTTKINVNITTPITPPIIIIPLKFHDQKIFNFPKNNIYNCWTYFVSTSCEQFPNLHSCVMSPPDALYLQWSRNLNFISVTSPLLSSNDTLQ